MIRLSKESNKAISMSYKLDNFYQHFLSLNKINQHHNKLESCPMITLDTCTERLTDNNI